MAPALSVMRADHLKHAVEIVNATGYGLTSGIESLDEREVEYWKAHIHAGNLYINRGTTGAIVLRQPFGGLGKSAIGTGRKAGVHNYLTQFMNFKETLPPEIKEKRTSPLVRLVDRWDTRHRFAPWASEIHQLQRALQSYMTQFEEEFSKERDFVKRRGEDNFFKYKKLNSVILRVCQGDGLFDSMARVLAAKVSKVKVGISLEENMDTAVSQFLFRYSPKVLDKGSWIKRESETNFVKHFPEVDRIMYSSPENISDVVFKQAAHHLKFILRHKPLMEGRVELLNFFEEQSISHSYHRYGNLGVRG